MVLAIGTLRAAGDGRPWVLEKKMRDGGVAVGGGMVRMAGQTTGPDDGGDVPRGFGWC